MSIPKEELDVFDNSNNKRDLREEIKILLKNCNDEIILFQIKEDIDLIIKQRVELKNNKSKFLFPQKN